MDECAPRRPGPGLKTALGVVTLAAAAGFFLLEKKRPLRRPPRGEPRRTMRNVVMGASSMAVVSILQKPLVDKLTDTVVRRRIGLAQQIPGPPIVRDAVAFLLLDYGIYVWHVLTHKVPFLWRFHLVHHVDLDMDTTTALRFHAVDMVISIPWRLMQNAVVGASPRAHRAWETFFFASVIFHHSNTRLPWSLERRLVRVLTTPRLHGIHHSARREHTDANWSSGLSLWDWLHGTGRLDVAQEDIVVGVPTYREELSVGELAALPFAPQKDAWSGPGERTPAVTRRPPSSRR
jgi:sterol desaturase/sphingolipid hydroxylase (fatty acid hydroxylase superfamily)